MQPLAFDTLAQIVALSRRLDASLEASARVLAVFAAERPDATFLVPADALDDDVGDSRLRAQLEHRADATAGDEAGTGAGRLEQHLAGAELAERRVRDRAAAQRDRLDVTLGILGRLADGILNLVRLTETDADVALAITDRNDRVEAETTSALDNLRDAIDGDELVLQVEFC